MTKNKTLKFTSDLADKILSGEKNTTWRIFDDKDLTLNDTLDLIRRPELEKFATAKIIELTEKPISQIIDADQEGHQKYESIEEIISSFQPFYKDLVDSQTPIKIIKFKLIQ